MTRRLLEAFLMVQMKTNKEINSITKQCTSKEKNDLKDNMKVDLEGLGYW